ncbi:unnamed protein product, partial [marine sediment metagenome]
MQRNRLNRGLFRLIPRALLLALILLPATSGVAQAAITQLVFITTAQPITAGEASEIMTIQTQDDGYEPADVAADTTINLSSTSAQGKFSLSAVSWVDITSVTITNGSNSVSFYYKDTTAGGPTITAEDDPNGYTGGVWIDDTQPQTIDPASLHHFTLSNISTQTAGTAFSITITAEDEFFNTATSYTGPNSLSDTTGTILPTTTGDFIAGVWADIVTITKAQ